MFVLFVCIIYICIYIIVKKVRPTVAKVFKCLFCNTEKSVCCKIDRGSMTGELVCSICDAKFQTQINTLTEPIDIFTEWLDETVDIQTSEARSIHQRQHQNQTTSSATNDDYEDDNDE